MTESWEYQHDDLDCPKCRTLEGSFALTFYLGTHSGRDAHKYSCTNEDCGYEKIEYIDELMEKEYSDEEKYVRSLIGTRITLSNNQKRVLREDKKGLYVIDGGLKSYVYYMKTYDKFAMTGEWDHKEEKR